MDTAGLALAVLQLSAHAVSAIYTYTQDVKAARTDIDRLNTELFALMGIFQRLTATAFPSVDRTSYASSLSSSAAASSTYAESTLTLVGDELMGEEKGEKGEYATGDGLPGNSLPHLSSLPGFSEMLQATSDLLKDLLDQLQIPKSKSMAQRKQLLKWPFKKDEVKQILERLERMKSYFLLSVMTNDTELTQGLVEEVRQLRREMQAAKEAAGKMDPEEERRKLATWLCPVDPEAMMKKVGERTTKGSGEWFVGGNKIKKWLEVGSGVFWLNGITGAGKTTLM